MELQEYGTPGAWSSWNTGLREYRTPETRASEHGSEGTWNSWNMEFLEYAAPGTESSWNTELQEHGEVREHKAPET